MINFLELVNAVGKVVKKHSPTYQVLPSKEAKFEAHGYDSLDCLMLCVYIGEVYGIPSEVNEKLFPTCVLELEEAIMANKTQEPESIEAVLAAI